MKKRLTAGLLLFAVLLAGSGCGNDKKLLQSTKEEKKTVMTVGDYEVPYELYRYVVLNIKDAYEVGRDGDIWLGEEGAALLDRLEEDVSDTIARLYTPFLLAEDYDIHTDDELIVDSVELAMESIYESYEYDYKAYDQAISEVYMNDGVYRLISLNEVVSAELFHAMLRKGEIEDDEAALEEIFRSDAFIRVKQILISATNGKSDEENRALARDLLAQLENGASFETLLKEYGQDLTMFNNPDGMYMMRGSYYTAFEDAAFALAVGEISGVVETPAGFSIIRRYEKEETYLTAHFDDLTAAYEESVFNLRLEAALAEVTVTPTENLADYSVLTMK